MDSGRRPGQGHRPGSLYRRSPVPGPRARPAAPRRARPCPDRPARHDPRPRPPRGARRADPGRRPGASLRLVRLRSRPDPLRPRCRPLRGRGRGRGRRHDARAGGCGGRGDRGRVRGPHADPRRRGGASAGLAARPPSHRFALPTTRTSIRPGTSPGAPRSSRAMQRPRLPGRRSWCASATLPIWLIPSRSSHIPSPPTGPASG